MAFASVFKEEDWHVRTTGFCISKQTASKLEFPRDTITTKNQCYFLEHRGESHTLMNQVLDMGLMCNAVAPLERSPLWDSGHDKTREGWFDRWDEHYEAFPQKKQTATFVCTIYNTFPEIISSLICQTNTNWKLILIHDGEETEMYPRIESYVDFLDDNRITFIKREHQGNWGHAHRQWALKQEDLLVDATHIVISNSDNWYAPTYIDKLLDAFKRNPNAVAVYPTQMAHNYWGYEVLTTKLKLGHIDCGQVMVRKDIAVEIGWNSMEFASDWEYFKDIFIAYGKENFISTRGMLFAHN